jgi:hypothetical protein
MLLLSYPPPCAHPCRYISRGLLATPVITALDHAGRSSWVTRALSNLTYPAYQATSSTVIYSALLLDWPARAWLLGPAGVATGWSKAVFGPRAAKAVGMLQRAVPGVHNVHSMHDVGVGMASASGAGGVGGVRKGCVGGGVEWVEVAPGGLVGSEVLGQQLWQVVNDVAGSA